MTLVIVGSGPVGMVAALLLKDLFDRIVVLERQSEDRFLRSRGFTFPIVFSPAARSVLDRIGAMEAIDAERSPYMGVTIHKRVFGQDLTWTVRRDDVYSHWRHHIINSLHQRLAEEEIDVVFDANVTDIDFDAQTCSEEAIGTVGFDLLLGADGMHSRTRRLMAAAHEGTAHGQFDSMLLDRWYAYRVPSVGLIDEKFGNDGDKAAHVHMDNVREGPSEKLRIITVGMTHPQREVSIVLKHANDITLDRLKELNDSFFGSLVESDVLAAGWDAGVAGEYRHVVAPTFCTGSTLLIGDAAHGFEGNGDLINLGITSVGALADMLADTVDIPTALSEYDETVGHGLRVYSDMAMRRSREKANFEIGAYEVGSLLGLNGHHPSLWGIFEDDFEIETYMDAYQRVIRRNDRAGVALAGAAFAGVAALAAKRRG